MWFKSSIRTIYTVIKKTGVRNCRKNKQLQCQNSLKQCQYVVYEQSVIDISPGSAK